MDEFCRVRDLSDKLDYGTTYSLAEDLAFVDSVSVLLRVPAAAMMNPHQPWQVTVVASVLDYVAEKRFSAKTNTNQEYL